MDKPYYRHYWCMYLDLYRSTFWEKEIEIYSFIAGVVEVISSATLIFFSGMLKCVIFAVDNNGTNLYK